MDEYRIQAWIDIARGHEWLIRRVSVFVLVLLLVSLVLNLNKPKMLDQVLVFLLGLGVMNAFASGMRRLAESSKSK